MSYTDVFGGSSVQAADVQFRAVALSASIYTVWPAFATTGNECARIMKVTPSVGSLGVNLPDTTLTSNGMDVLFDNAGAFSFTVYDYAGGTIATVAPGEVKYLYLSDNSTAAGTWRVTLFGVGAASVDAAQLQGYGVKAIGSTLNLAPPVSNISSNTTVTLADRAKVFVWTGGSGTLTLPSTAASTSDFSIEVHNQGSGTLTVATTGGVVVDGSATIALITSESCIIHMGATDWYTVGRGRNTQFNFTQLNKVVTGGTVNLTLNEASNVVQTFTGALLSNQTVNQPAVVQVYYVSNATTGAYTLTFGCVAGGTTVGVTQGQAAILFCDGTNVINANTSLSGGIATVIFGAGSAASPSAAFSTANTGFYSSGSNEIGVANNGVYTGKFTTGGYKTEVTGAAAVQAISSGGASSLVADRPAGSVGSVRLRTAGVDRWSIEATSTAEAGANAGTNLAINAYSDVGALLGTVATVARSSQIATFTQPPVMSGASVTGLPVSTGISGLGANVATFLATPSSSNLAAAVTGETGSGELVFATSPTLVTPVLGTPTSGTLTNCTGLPVATGISGLGTGVATALAVNVGSAGAPVVNGGALGTPSSGTVTNLTGTASININGTVGATTPSTGAFTTISATGATNLDAGTVSAPGLYLEGETGTGLYRIGANNHGYAVGGAKVLGIASTGLAVTGTLSATSTIKSGTTGTLGKYQLARSTDGAFVSEIRLTGAGASPDMDIYNGVASATNIYSAGAIVAAATSAGLAVTGTLSATGDVTIGSSGASKSFVGFNTDGSVIYSGGTTGALGAAVVCFAQSHATAPNQMHFRNSGNTTRMTLDASGNLGIGTTAPNFRLDVLDGTNIYRQLCLTEVKTNSTRNRTGVVAQSYVAATPAQVLLMDANTSTNDLYVGGGYSGAYAATNVYLYSAANSTTVIGTQVFQIAHGKSLALQGATSQTGCGISFPSTQVASSDANTLDDYEEGTWTPTITFGGAAVGVTYTTQSGTYTKIGNLVTVTYDLILSAKGSSTGAVRITNLPFTSKSGITQAVPQPFSTGIVTATSVGGYITTADTSIQLQNSITNYSSALLDSNISATTRFAGSFSYLV